MTTKEILLIRAQLDEIYKKVWFAKEQVADEYKSWKTLADDSTATGHLFDEKECLDGALYRLSDAMDYLLAAQCFAHRREVRKVGGEQ